MEDLRAYFESTRGTGMLATSHADGRTNAALYSRPRVMDDGTVALVMLDRRSHAYLSTNPHAAYLFHESPATPGAGKYSGVRLALTRVSEEENTSRLQEMVRPGRRGDGARRFLVFFRVDEVRPLGGDG